MSPQSASVMRVTTFRPRDPWQELDHRLRDEVLPRFAARSGLLSCWAGRRGAEGSDQRAIVSVWMSAADETAAPAVPDMLEDLAEQAARIVDQRIDVLPIAIIERFARTDEMRILRLFRGTVVAGQLERYIERARDGTLEDGARENGPAAVVMGILPPDGFVTASTWPDWAAIEAATGGNVAHPLLTRSRELIRDGEPTHFEMVAAFPGPQS